MCEVTNYQHYGVQFKMPNQYANWEICEAYKMSGRNGRPRKSPVTDIKYFKDKEFGRLWIEANSIDDNDARSFALESLVAAHERVPDIHTHINSQLAGFNKSLADVSEAAKDLAAHMTTISEVTKQWQLELGRV